jgi:GT2 family glycosyltransferase
MRIAVISVLYGGGRGRELWARGIERAQKELDAPVDVDVIVVDNGPTEDGAGPLPGGSRVVRPARNIGFAAGCNAGINQASGADLVVLLNPDVELGKDFIRRLLELKWPHDLAARGPAVMTPEGQVEQSARTFPTAKTGLLGRTSLLARVRPTSSLVTQQLRADPAAGTQAVDWVSGACLVAPAERFDQIGLFDEGYFMYWEDADWCRRARDRGYRVEYEPTLMVIHRQGASARSRPFFTTVVFHRSALRYWRRHVSRSVAATGLAAVALAARCAIKLITGATRSLGHRRD